MKAIYIEQTGGPEVLRYGDQPRPEPGAGQVLVKITAAGINFIDTYHRSGLYKIPLPGILGSEGAGVVEALGSGVDNFKVATTSRGPMAGVRMRNTRRCRRINLFRFRKPYSFRMQRPYSFKG